MVVGFVGQEGGLDEQRDRASRELEFPEARGTGLSAFPEPLQSCGKLFTVKEFGKAVGEFHDGERPGGVHESAIAHPLVQEEGGAIFARLLRIDLLRPEAEYIGRCQAHVVIHHIGDGGLQANAQAECRVPEIGPFSRIGRLDGALDAGRPLIAQVREETGFQPSGFAGLRSRGEFQEVHREIARLQEHRRSHFHSRLLLDGQTALPGCVLAVADAGGTGAGRPLEQRHVHRPEPALFHPAPKGGFTLGVRTVRIQADQSDFLALGQEREEKQGEKACFE